MYNECTDGIFNDELSPPSSLLKIAIQSPNSTYLEHPQSQQNHHSFKNQGFSVCVQPFKQISKLTLKDQDDTWVLVWFVTVHSTSSVENRG